MPLAPQSPEFARLATRWLDRSATAAEAALLWESVRADPKCAQEFADQARFELLLQDTLCERADEAGMAAVARTKVKEHGRRMVQRRVLAAAAILLLAGFIAWLAIPGDGSHEQLAQAKPGQPQRASTPKAKRATVLMARQGAERTATSPTDPLQKRLDQFFLISVSLNKVPLKLALKQLEDQLRELNFASSADLAALRVKLPGEVGNRLVTFHSGSISFLKALRALAGLADCDVDVTENSVALVLRPDSGPARQESRTLEQLLASMGGSSDAARNRLLELLHDARSLGLEVNMAADGSTITGLKATRGEFDALTLLAQSRDQVRGLPPLNFYVKATRAMPGAKDRILSDDDSNRAREQLLSLPGPSPSVVTIPLTETGADGTSPEAGSQPGDVSVSAGPVGNNMVKINIIPVVPDGPVDSGRRGNEANPELQIPISAYAGRPDGLQFVVASSGPMIGQINIRTTVAPGAVASTGTVGASSAGQVTGTVASLAGEATGSLLKDGTNLLTLTGSALSANNSNAYAGPSSVNIGTLTLGSVSPLDRIDFSGIDRSKVISISASEAATPNGQNFIAQAQAGGYTATQTDAGWLLTWIPVQP